MNVYFISVLILVIGDCIVNHARMTCKNHHNETVDWFILYKLPKLKNVTGNKFIKRGSSYMYITSGSKTKEWTLADVSIDDSQSLLGMTLAQFYNKTTPLYHILYNDQPPNEKFSETKGHTKGILMGDKETSFWIVHSVPHFPPIWNSSYQYPGTGHEYGQSALCITYDTKSMNDIMKQMLYNDPKIYSAKWSDLEYLNETMPDFVSLIKPAQPPISNPPWNRSIITTSYGGKQFWSFAKYRRFDKDLYENWLADEFKSDLFTETWLNSPGPLPSNCTTHYHVYNINTITFSGHKVKFASALDHSKWAVDTTKWICIGDINREKHQAQRGGGTVCTNDRHLWNIYKNLIYDVDPCIKLLNHA